MGGDVLDWADCLVAVIVGGVVLAKCWWLLEKRDADGPRIKRYYESGGRRVLSIEPAGFEYGGRWSPSFRKYEIVVQHPLDGVRTYQVGVQAGAWFDPDLKQYDWFGG
jgi:hypothetical protein